MLRSEVLKRSEILERMVISSSAGTVVALAGRRIDAEPTDEPKFPFERVGAVRDAITAKLMSEQARALVCSAACGADLLALDAAEELELRTRVILPFPRCSFAAPPLPIGRVRISGEACLTASSQRHAGGATSWNWTVP